VAEARCVGASIRFVAATLPGHGGTQPPVDLSIEGYARLAGKLAADRGCDVVVGHSMGANVAIEMVAAREFSGPLVLLAPSFSRKDESRFPRVLDLLGRVLGHLPVAVSLKMIGVALKGSLPSARHDALVAELRKNDPRIARQHLHLYLKYLDRHGSVAPRLCDSGARAWVVFGDLDDIGLTDDERRTLEECPQVTLVTIPDVGHFTLNVVPDRVSEILLEAISE
jgi:pimeloyl-ACP methyl ester carboxylesterase